MSYFTVLLKPVLPGEDQPRLLVKHSHGRNSGEADVNRGVV